MTEGYSVAVLDHFARPRNLGRLPDANGRGVAGDLREQDVRIEIAVRVEAGRVAAARFRTFGCSAAIAASSMATTLIEGQAVERAGALRGEEIATALGGLPPERLYAPALAAAAVHEALADYHRQAGRAPATPGAD